MKTLFRSVILVCAMAVTSFATAASFTVKETKSSVFRVQYMSGQSGKVAVSILNKMNQLVFEEKISSNGSFIRPYNFSNLAQGEYTIVLKDENGEQRQTINYSLVKSTFAHVSEIPNQEGKYWLKIVNSVEQNMNVRIYSLKGDLLFDQSVSIEGTYSKVFNVAQLNQPAVVFEVSNANGVVYTSLFE